MAMVVLGGVVGAIAGFVIGVAIHVIFWNDSGLADVIPFALGAAGVLAGSALGRRYVATRNA